MSQNKYHHHTKHVKSIGEAAARAASRLLQNSRSNALDLSQIEARLTGAIRQLPIGGVEGRRLFSRRAKVREALAATQRATAGCATREAFLDLP